MKRLLLTLLTSTVLSATAQAGLLDIQTTGGSLAGSLPLGGAHDVNETKGATGWYNANLYATENVTLTYEFLGFEAGWTNSFSVDGSAVFQNRDYGGTSASTVGDTANSSASAGALLAFGFEILKGGNAGESVQNGGNNYPIDTFTSSGYGLPNFFLGYADTDQNSVYITLDDGGGKPWTNTSIDDDNHDDLVVKVTASRVEVPESSTAALLIFGLAGLMLMRKRS